MGVGGALPAIRVLPPPLASPGCVCGVGGAGAIGGLHSLPQASDNPPLTLISRAALRPDQRAGKGWPPAVASASAKGTDDVLPRAELLKHSLPTRTSL